MIETEIKFVYEEEKTALLTADATFLGKKELTDTYFDDDEYSLFLPDTYLRERNGMLELKLPLQDNSGIIRAYEERTKNIQDVLQKPLSAYAPQITVHTARKSYEKDGVRIDLDLATINGKTYRIGELEILDDENAETLLNALLTQYDLTPITHGKLFLYIRDELPELFTRLVKQGVTRTN